MYKKIQSYLKMINSLMTSKKCVIFLTIGENSIPINNEYPRIVNIQENLTVQSELNFKPVDEEFVSKHIY